MQYIKSLLFFPKVASNHTAAYLEWSSLRQTLSCAVQAMLTLRFSPAFALGCLVSCLSGVFMVMPLICCRLNGRLQQRGKPCGVPVIHIEGSGDTEQCITSNIESALAKGALTKWLPLRENGLLSTTTVHGQIAQRCLNFSSAAQAGLHIHTYFSFQFGIQRLITIASIFEPADH